MAQQEQPSDERPQIHIEIGDLFRLIGELYVENKMLNEQQRAPQFINVPEGNPTSSE